MMATVIIMLIVEIAVTCLQNLTLILLHTHRVNKNTKGNYFYLLTRNFWLDNYRSLWWFLFGRCVGLCSRDVWLEEDWKHEDRKILSCSFTGQLSYWLSIIVFISNAYDSIPSILGRHQNNKIVIDLYQKIVFHLKFHQL